MTEGAEIRSEPLEKPAFRAPYCEATWQDIQKTIPGAKPEMAMVLSDLDRQCVENFSLFRSERFPGVELSVVKLTPTKELVGKIAGISIPEDASDESDNPLSSSKVNEQWFLFSAFAKPPDGNAFGSLDIGIDRYVQLLQKVARRIKAGEQTGEFNIYLIGSGTGFGEKITQEYIDAIKNQGLSVRGKLNAEIVEHLLPKTTDGDFDIDNNRIVFQGVSMGTTSIDNMLPYLPEIVRKNSQALLDSPAGTHKPHEVWKAAQTAVGLLSEYAYRELLDNTAKVLGAGKKPFIELMQSEGKTEADSDEQTKLKRALANTSSLKLLKGQPLHTEDNRYFIRERTRDILSAGPVRVARRLVVMGKAQVLKDSGKSLKAVVRGPHFFEFRHHSRWEQILKYVSNVKPPAA